MADTLVWKILLIDDDEDDYLLTREMLAMAQGKEIRLTWASTMDAARQAITSEAYDAILVDYDLGEHNGLEFIQEISARNLKSPLLLITGRGSYQVDLEAMQAGAALYLTKAELNPLLLDRSIRYAIEKKQAELALQQAHEELENRVEERTRELAQANRDLQKTKLDLAARVVERTAELQHANKLLADQLKEHQRVLAELQREKKTGEQERDKLRDQEEKVARLSRLYIMLSRVNEAIVRTQSAEQLYSQACEIIAEGGFPLVWIGEVQGQLVVPVAYCGPASGYLKEIRVETSGPLGNGPSGRCIRERHPVINPDFDTNPNTLPWRAAASRYGIHSSASFPLFRRGQPIGSLTLYTSEVHSFDPDQVTLIEQLSEDISFALDALDQEGLRVAAEQALRTGEQRYRALFENMQEGFYLGQAIFDESGQPIDFLYLDANETYGRMIGIQRQQIINRKASEIFPQIRPEWLELFGRVQQTGEPAQHTGLSDFFQHYFEAFVFRPAEGQFAAVVNDVSERLKAEQALHETQERMKWLARFPEENPNPVVRADLEGRVLYCNPIAEKPTEWGSTVGQLLPDPFLEGIRKALSQAMVCDEVIHLGSKSYAVSFIPLPNEGYINIYGRDIVLRIKAEQALRKSEERYRTLFNSVKEGFALSQPIYDEQGKLADMLVIEANPSAETIISLKRDEFVGKTWHQVWPDLPDEMWQVYQKVFSSGEEVHREEYDPALARWYDVRHFPAGPDLMGSTFMDITERKQAESKIAAEHLWFRTTLESIGDAVITTDAEGKITFLNPIAEKLSGWNNLQAAGEFMEKIFPLVNEQNGEQVENPVDKVLRSGGVVGLANHTVLVTKDGRVIPIEDSASPIKDSLGQTLGVVMVFHDVVEKRAREKKLQQSEALYHAVARNIPEGAVFVVDREMRFLAVEGALLKALGFSKSRMEGHTIREILNHQVLDLVEEHFRRALAGETISLEFKFKGRILFSQYLPLVAETGSALAAMALLTDITQRKKDEENLRDAERIMKDYAQKLERSNRDLQDFASIASHDLQEPLRKIKSFGELLKKRVESRLDEQDNDYLKRILGATQRMQEQIDSLLSFSRVTTKTLPFRQVSLNEAAAEAIASLEGAIEREGGRVETGDLPGVYGDPLQLRQVIQNLLGNALKFHCPGVPPVVKLSGRVEPARAGGEAAHAILEVQDNGIGFEMQYLDRIFLPFERLHGVNDYPGTGMGLAICKKIVERHQGAITARSVMGEGSTFIVTLPVNEGV